MKVYNKLSSKYLAQGIEKGIATVVRNMIANGIDTVIVYETTVLTEAQLEAIKSDKIIH